MNSSTINKFHDCEKRLYTRAARRQPLKIFYAGREISQLYTENICIGGALIKADETGLPENTLITIMFDVNGWHPLFNVKIPSIVVRKTDIDFAIAFEVLLKDIEEFLKN